MENFVKLIKAGVALTALYVLSGCGPGFSQKVTKEGSAAQSSTTEVIAPTGTTTIDTFGTTAIPRNVIAGKISYLSQGSNVFVVPEYNKLYVQVWGAGGGGGGSGQELASGMKGGDSHFGNDVYATGGNGGVFGYSQDGLGQSGGMGSGGDISYEGQRGGNSYDYNGGQGGVTTDSTVGGPAGGSWGYNKGYNGRSASENGIGGGGAGGGWLFGVRAGGGGAGGGYVLRTYTYPDLPVGAEFMIEVGVGGAGGQASAKGGNGYDGKIIINWE